MTAPLTELADRVERAGGPDRELDCLIHTEKLRGREDAGDMITVGLPTYDPPRHFFNPMPSVHWIGYDLLRVAPRFTASIDAAMTLVPEDRFVGALSQCEPLGEWYARIEAFDAVYEDATATTPALALTASALRARAAALAGDAPK